MERMTSLEQSINRISQSSSCDISDQANRDFARTMLTMLTMLQIRQIKTFKTVGVVIEGQINDTHSLNISPYNDILERLRGKGHESEILIDGVKVKGLIVTGSMVSTIAEELLCKLNESPVIHLIDELGLRVNTANGQSMPYSGVVDNKNS